MFGGAHKIAIAATVAVSFALAAAGRWRLSEDGRHRLGIALAAILAISEVGLRVVHYQHGTLTTFNGLPMHACDWALITAAIALVTRAQWVFEWAYFFSLAGATQAVFTPDLRWGWPDLRFIAFFMTHSTILAAVAYMTLGCGRRPKPGWVFRVFVCGQLYVASAFLVNWLVDANYGFLSYKPAGGSLLDYLGPEPWHVIGLEIAALVFFSMYYLPYFIADRIRARRAAALVIVAVSMFASSAGVARADERGIEPRDVFLLKLADMLLSEKKPEEALRFLEPHLERHDEDLQARLQAVRAYKDTGETDKEAAGIRAALALIVKYREDVPDVERLLKSLRLRLQAINPFLQELRDRSRRYAMQASGLVKSAIRAREPALAKRILADAMIALPGAAEWPVLQDEILEVEYRRDLPSGRLINGKDLAGWRVARGGAWAAKNKSIAPGATEKDGVSLVEFNGRLARNFELNVDLEWPQEAAGVGFSLVYVQLRNLDDNGAAWWFEIGKQFARIAEGSTLPAKGAAANDPLQKAQLPSPLAPGQKLDMTIAFDRDLLTVKLGSTVLFRVPRDGQNGRWKLSLGCAGAPVQFSGFRIRE